MRSIAVRSTDRFGLLAILAAVLFSVSAARPAGAQNLVQDPNFSQA
jgi:hypothetical protein